LPTAVTINMTGTSNTTATKHLTPAPESRTYSTTLIAEPIPFFGDNNRLPLPQ
jgi:hypothetical protein